jgi:proline racemase
MRPRNDLTPEEFPETVETAKAIRACKRVRVTSLATFIEACKASTDAERIGGLLVDMTTKSMISQIWDRVQNYDQSEKLIGVLTARFDNALIKYGKKVAIYDVVDRFWKLASSK